MALQLQVNAYFAGKSTSITVLCLAVVHSRLETKLSAILQWWIKDFLEGINSKSGCVNLIVY